VVGAQVVTQSAPINHLGKGAGETVTLMLLGVFGLSRTPPRQRGGKQAGEG
jgi:hypothetical protein